VGGKGGGVGKGNEVSVTQEASKRLLPPPSTLKFRNELGGESVDEKGEEEEEEEEGEALLAYKGAGSPEVKYMKLDQRGNGEGWRFG
jgi:hypothetical protein